MTDELIPCACCGARQSDEDEPLGVWWVPADDTWQVCCDRCGARTPYFRERDAAVEAWNRGRRNE